MLNMDKSKTANNICSKCSKPVYFAERKTSLGRDWHPTCLKCEECGKVLTPGQHAEHKGMPYCHRPCYGALFGPLMSGYGSNVYSPANFRKSTEVRTSSINTVSDESQDGIKCIFKTTNTSPSPLRLQKSGSTESAPKVFQKRNSNGSIEFSENGSSGYYSNSESNSSLNTNGDSGYKCIYQSSAGPSKKTHSVARSNSGPDKLKSPIRQSAPVRGSELFKRVQSYNDHHQTKRGQTLALTEEEGNVRVQGPLRIYWGLKKPIILKQFDEVPSKPIPKKRFSVITDHRDLQPLEEIRNESGSPKSPKRMTFSSGQDDSILSSPSSDVVMRRHTNIKKSNTVAYRGDRPNKWKRASINGHIYNYDTSVFTPVLGSCTSVTVNNKMTVRQVIKTLLDKFKVENEPEEYDLCIITEEDSERSLKDTDIPLLERLMVGPTDSVKIFIRDRPNRTPAPTPADIPGDHSPTTETPPLETPLPEEVEQLMNIPEPVLRGLLEKFKKDEEQEIRRLKAKYERFRKRVQQIIADKKANISRC